MIPRTLQAKILHLAKKYPVITVTGPRQSGKSTLLKATFKDYKYVSLENPDIRKFATEDPNGFLKTYHDKTIIDEVQNVPSIFSYIQTHIDDKNKCGMYILTGSQNFLLMQTISQTLAGRTAVLTLLPLSQWEIFKGKYNLQTIENEIFTGCYPRIFDKNIAPPDFYPFYIQTYVERDVRTMKNIGDLSKFIRFIKLCAGRIGQILNISSLANDCGISVSCANSWLSILEASYVCYLLNPDYNNFAKRLVKSPKLYFYDTGLACSLLDIKSADQINIHFLRGGLFENFVITEFLKYYYNNGTTPDLTFWRDSTGNEIDLIDNRNMQQYAYEIKSGTTFSSDYFKGLQKWAKLSGAPTENCRVIYNGENQMYTSNGILTPWKYNTAEECCKI